MSLSPLPLRLSLFSSFDANNTLGALLIGLFVSCCFFGITSVQLYIYYSRFRDDKSLIKAMVTVIWLLELAHCICICDAFYFFSVTGYGDPFVLLKFPISLDVSVLISGLISTMVQAFFIDRIRAVSGRMTVAVVAWTLTTCRFAFILVIIVTGVRMTSLPVYLGSWRWVLITAMSFGVVLDFMIMVSLWYYLRSMGPKFASTSFMVDTITTWTIQTGAVTGVIELLVIVCFVVWPNNFIWLSIYILVSRVFSNSLLGTLNGRVVLRNCDESNILRVGPQVLDESNLQIQPGLEVRVTQATVVKVDTTYEWHGII